MGKIRREESKYVDLPKLYAFRSEREKEIMLNNNFRRVNAEISDLVDMLLCKKNDTRTDI